MIRALKAFLLATFLALVAGEALAAESGGVSADRPIVSIRESVKVDGKLIYIGDLFTNAGKKSGIAVAHAPAPGKRAVFDIHWLYRVSRNHQLDWRPMSRRDRVVVERTGTVISRDEIGDYLLGSLLERGAEPDMTIEFSNRMLKLYVASDQSAQVGVEDVIFDPRTRRFSAMIHAAAGDPAAQRHRVTGKVYRTIEVPVPARRVLAGEIINRNDVKWIRMRSARLQPDIIVNEVDLVGKSPKRGLRAGYPVRMSAVRRPVLVPKGSLVTMILKTPQMTLTAQGKALENGSESDVIRITNTQSKNVVEAEVVGTGRVVVRVATIVALNDM